ncbi:MAG: DNA translocase FtsK 4TM domain-containing protein [Bacteroidota bacterium]
MTAHSGNKNKLKNQAAATAESSSKKKKPRSKAKSSTKKERWQRFRVVTGLFLALFAVFLVLVFISYLYQWFVFGNDEALLHFSFSEVLEKDFRHTNWGGRVGAFLSYQFINQWFGISSFLIAFYLFVLGIYLATKHKMLKLGRSLRYIIALVLWISLAAGFVFHESESLSILGGVFGYEGTEMLISVAGRTGTGFLLLFILLSITTFAFNIPLRWMNPEKWKARREAKRKQQKEKAELKKKAAAEATDAKADAQDDSPQSPKNTFNTEEYAVDDEEEDTAKTEISEHEEETKTPSETAARNTPGKAKETSHNGEVEFTIENPTTDEDVATEEKEPPKRQGLDTEYDPTLDLPHYKFPPKDLLNDYSGNTDIRVEKQELEENKQQIVNTLKNYNIKVTSIKATPGPTITLYEIVPAPGIRISKIKNLEDDIAMSLAAHGIRIIAPIPGRGTIGIEVPNNNPLTVSMKSILVSKKFVHSDYDLPIGLGKTISNESFIADLAKMPHLLMAGATGQGKSVGLNAIITSLVYKKHPAVLKFILVDPKKVELTLYNKIERHYLAKLPDNEEAIVTDTREVVRTLNSLVIEMEDRYNLLKDAQVKGINEYNKKFISRRLNPENGHRYMPYIVVVIDEFADLIMTAGKEIEGPITRLAQLARAIGIHLIIATQRPSVNIITGSIKANFPARIAYRVISKVDSRTILDTGGADQLVGRGDMLLSTGKELVRLQGAFIDTDEIEEITEYIGSQRAYSEAFKLPEYYDEETDTSKDLEDLGRDELFDEAARLVVSNQHGSTSLLQRKMKIGYNRAGRIIDQLEAAGIVGPFEGSKAREVLIKDAVALEQLLEELSNNKKE